jgi:protein involved in polysaccharide export with SLBB domain
VPAGVGATSGLQGGYRPDVGLPWPGFLTGTAASADASRYFVGPEAMSYLNALSTVPERYQLGPGDTLLLRYWSPTLEPRDVSLRLDERGVITLPIGGTLVARGQTLAQLEATLRRTLSRLINKVDLSLTMKDLRTISVLITGEAFAPGSYQMPAVATLFNALYACGGPSDQGSIRRIQLKRTDGTTHTFDFIRFLEGDGTQDAPLQPGDTIYIPLAESLVAVKGEVQRPAIYELTDKERLRDAVRFAGGTKPSGVVQRVSVDSVKPGIERRQVDANLLAAGDANNPVLYDGDTVEVLSIRPETKNAVDIEGAVDQPSRYAWATGMTVADLLERARGVLEDAYLDRADLYRANPDNTQTLIPLDLTKALQRDPQANVALERRDRLVVYRLQDVAFLGFRRVEASGAVQRPGYYTRADGMHVRDLVLQAGGPLPEAAAERAFLQRRNADGSFGPLINLDLLKAAAGDSDQNLLLQDRDVLAVYTRRQADYTPENVVEVKGAVQAPGTYPRAANMRLKDLLNVAGGLLPNAADSLEIAHARTPVNTPVDNVALAALPQAGPDAGGPILSDGDVVTIHSRQDFRMRPVTVIVKGAVKRPGPYALASETESLSDIVRRAGGLANNAFPQGAQMYRKPELLTTDVQQTLAPRVQALLDMVQQAEYRRALARSDVDKLRAVSSKGSSTPAVAIPGAIAPTGGDVSAATMDQVASKLAGRDLVTPARPLTDDDLLPAGNLSIDLMAAMSAPHTRKDVVLREDDFIDIPEKPTTVTVSGAVMVPSSVTYESGKSLADYLAGAGGLAQDAAKDQILIIRATGQVLRAKGRVKVELGDIILVPTRVMYDKLKSNQSVWDSIISRITGGALVYAVIRSLTK